MAKPVSVVPVGLGGYGEVYLKALLDAWDDAQFDLVGAVEPTPTNCSRLDELRARGVRVYTSLESFYEASWADLVVIASPIHCHCAQTCSALLRGSHVLCEKPPAATVQEVDQMIEQIQEMQGVSDQLEGYRPTGQVIVDGQPMNLNALRNLLEQVLNGQLQIITIIIR